MKPRTRQSDAKQAARPKTPPRQLEPDEIDDALVRRYGRSAFSRDILDNRRRR